MSSAISCGSRELSAVETSAGFDAAAKVTLQHVRTRTAAAQDRSLMFVLLAR
jgi:hypothetical protein